MNFAGLIIARLDQTVGFVNRIVLEAPRLREFFQVIDTVPAIRDKPGAIDPGRVKGLVEFKDVSFSYDGKQLAVAHLNFKVLPGEMVALVGATGAGKSTAIALLHRAFDPQSGVIEIDGMVSRLADRLKKDGSDFDGWMRLVRSYVVLGERDKAVSAVTDARAAIGSDAEKRRQFDDFVKSLGLDG